MTDLTPVQQAAVRVISNRLHNTIEARISIEELADAGFRLIPPDDFPGLCQRCKNVIEPGTRHEMFNGNQMFACEIIRD